jgi:hypothetical protein
MGKIFNSTEQLITRLLCVFVSECEGVMKITFLLFVREKEHLNDTLVDSPRAHISKEEN